MPKIRRDEIEEDETEEDESQFEFDEELEQEEEKPVKKKPLPSPVIANLPRSQQPQPPKRRYGIVPPQPARIIDTEGKEVVAEGEYLIAQALTDILERLERIENTLGSMIGG